MQELRKLLEKYGADFALLQSVDKYTGAHCENSQLTRYTGFTGSAGEAVLAKNGDIYLFVDPRYHIQADSEAKDNVRVIKLQMSQKLTDAMAEVIDKGKTLAVSAHHTSIQTLDKLKEHFKVKCVPFEDVIEETSDEVPYDVPKELCGEESESKIQKVQEFIKAQGADGYLVCALEDIAYLLNKRSRQIPYSSAFRAKLYIDSKGAHLEPFTLGKKVIINPQSTSVADLEAIKEPVVLEENFIAQMASVKNEAEIEHLKVCFRRLDKALENFKRQIKSGLSECDLKDIIEGEILAQGAVGLSFKTILAIGENSSSIHYSACSREKILASGDIILLDCGSYNEGGLATDITRVFVCGKPSDEQKTVYTRVLQAFLRAFNSKATSGFELDAHARDFLKNTAPKGFSFPHALGHGIGVAVHQAPPSISPADKEKKPLQQGNVFTIEPGLYAQGKFGVRLENTIYIDEEGKKVSFSRFPFEDALIDYDLLNEDEKLWLKQWRK